MLRNADIQSAGLYVAAGPWSSRLSFFCSCFSSLLPPKRLSWSFSWLVVCRRCWAGLVAAVLDYKRLALVGLGIVFDVPLAHVGDVGFCVLGDGHEVEVSCGSEGRIRFFFVFVFVFVFLYDE